MTNDMVSEERKVIDKESWKKTDIPVWRKNLAISLKPHLENNPDRLNNEISKTNFKIHSG